MNNLMTSDGVVLTRLVEDISTIEYESIHLKNKLLDGSYHIQTIGDPQKSVTVSVYSNGVQVAQINEFQASGQSLKLIDDDLTYTGFIDEPISWSRKTPKRSSETMWYYGTFRFIIIGTETT